MTDKHEPRTEKDETNGFMKLAVHNPYSSLEKREREDSAIFAGAIISAGVALFLSIGVSGFLSSGLPRIGYFAGTFITSWFILTWALTNWILTSDRW